MDKIILQQLCEQISQLFPVLALPAQIVNDRRWESLSEAAPDNFPVSPPHRIRLSDSFGVVIYDWPKLSPDQQEKISNMCEKN